MANAGQMLYDAIGEAIRVLFLYKQQELPKSDRRKLVELLRKIADALED